DRDGLRHNLIPGTVNGQRVGGGGAGGQRLGSTRPDLSDARIDAHAGWIFSGPLERNGPAELDGIGRYGELLDARGKRRGTSVRWRRPGSRRRSRWRLAKRRTHH